MSISDCWIAVSRPWGFLRSSNGDCSKTSTTLRHIRRQAFFRNILSSGRVDQRLTWTAAGFISIAGGAGLGLLLPYALYRSLAYGFGASNVNVRAYERFGPEAALRAIAPVDQFYITSSHGEPAVDVNKWSLTIDGLITDPLHFDYDDIRKVAPYETTLTLGMHFQRSSGWTD